MQGSANSPWRLGEGGGEVGAAHEVEIEAAGGSGFTQPSSKAWSMVASSMALIVTGSLLISRTHEPSHGAGQSVPVGAALAGDV